MHVIIIIQIKKANITIKMRMLIKNILFGVKFPSENVCAQQKAVYIVSNENDVEEHIPLSFHRY